MIAIIGRCGVHDGTSVIATNENYRLAIIKSGGIPFILVPTDIIEYGITLPDLAKRLSDEEKNDLYKVLAMCDGIVMPGGVRWYQFDEIVCQYAIDNRIPILGICLGMQILGSMDQFDGIHDSDKTTKIESNINHAQDDKSYVHECILKEGFLKNILNLDRVNVNSRHHYQIKEKDYFQIDAYSSDGVIEALHIPNHEFALGVQWHPEDMISYDPNMHKIFNTFIEKAKTKRKKKI